MWSGKSTDLPSSQTTDYSCACDGSTAYGYYVLQFGFEDAVEVFRGANGDNSVRIGEGGEDADSVSQGYGQSL